MSRRNYNICPGLVIPNLSFRKLAGTISIFVGWALAGAEGQVLELQLAANISGLAILLLSTWVLSRAK